MMNGTNGQRLLMAEIDIASGAGKITRAKIRRRVHEQEYRCGLSGLKLSPAVSTCDHILPVSRGGGNDMENIMVLHRLVNASKATMTPLEFIGLCHTVVEYNRNVNPADAKAAFLEYANPQE